MGKRNNEYGREVVAEMIVSGRVQMVMFRDFVCRNARRLRLSGFVRNRDDGTVYIALRGGKNQIRWLKDKIKRGSVLSRVDSVHCLYPEEGSTLFADLQQLSTFSIVYE